MQGRVNVTCASDDDAMENMNFNVIALCLCVIGFPNKVH